MTLMDSFSDDTDHGAEILSSYFSGLIQFLFYFCSKETMSLDGCLLV